MLMTLAYAYLTYLLEWRRRGRRMKYVNLIRQISRNASVLIRETSPGHFWPPPASYKDTTDRLQDGCGEITYNMPKKVLDLNGWTLYLNISQDITCISWQYYVLCEAVNLPSPTEHTSTTPQQDCVQVTDHGNPLAWRPGPPFQFLMLCDLDDLVTLAMGMLDNRLVAEDNLHIKSLTTVDIEGQAEKLISTCSSPSLWSSKPQPISTEPLDLSSNESLASVGKAYFTPEQISEWREAADFLNETNNLDRAVLSNSHMADGDHGECSAGEAMAEFAEDTCTTGPGNFADRTRSKPPNVLIYCGKKDSSRKFEGVRQIFAQCLNPERYVIYHLKHDQVHQTPWQDHSTLLILSSEKLYDGVDEAVLKYFNNGGRVMSFCSSLDDFLTEREIIQSSPMNLLRLSCADQQDVTVIGGRCCYSAVKSNLHGVSVRQSWDVLATANDFTDKPVIVKLETTVDKNHQKGIIILSQVYLDKDPGEMGISTKIFAMLKESNSAKFEIVTNLLQQLDLDCSRQMVPPPLSPALLLAGEQESIDSLLDAISPRLKDGSLRSSKKSLKFVGKPETSDVTSTEEVLMVLSQQGHGGYKVKYFREDLYFQNLKSKILGQVVLYTDVVPTTMTVLDGMMFSIPSDVGVVAIAGRQTSGRGRGGNAWLSPLGCAMFTLHVRIPADSELGHKAAFLQHITSVAVVHSVRSLPEYQEIDLRLKWPNDIYFGKSLKLGGVVVTSTIMTGVIHALIGCGFNVSNSNPTICINDIIRQYNVQNGTTLAAFSTEQLLGRVISIMEVLVDQFQKHGPEQFCHLYYQYWLHSDARVRLESEGGAEVVIRGLDEHGFLQVCTEDGRSLSVQPDGNSFDMLQNLITFKAG